MQKVLVTGANGHVGFNLVQELVRRGYHVRASVRDPNDAAKTAHLKATGAELVAADLMQPESLQAALQGMDGLFQVAAVYQTQAKDPEKEIIAPSVTGGLNALRAARKCGVKKVVFTSSVAAVGSHAPPDKPLTEDNWNDGAVNPYFIAKTQAERQAWDFAKEVGLKLVVINPVAIIGPGFQRHTPSTVMFEQILRGKLPLALPLGYSFVDVRDIALAHLLAYENDKAAGRYLCSARYFEMHELMQYLRDIDPQIKAPRHSLPRFMLPLVPAMDWFMHHATGSPRQASRDLVAEMGGRCQRVSTAKIERELGWKPREFKTSLLDTLEWIRNNFIRKGS